jgi:PilZ domain
MSQEKRRSGRIFFDMPAVLSVLDTRFTVQQIANLSVGGCLLEIKDNIPVGAECEIKILIDGTPQGLKVDANGIIVRNDDETVGIKFTRIDPENSFHLKNIVKFSLPILKYHPVGRNRS